MIGRLLIGVLFLAATLFPAAGQDVAGVVFEDLDGDGLQDAGEAGLSGVSVRLYGRPDAGGTFDTTVTTDGGGAFSFTPGAGCYLLQVQDPPLWRRTLARYDERADGSPGYVAPAGLRRFGGSPQLLDTLAAGGVRFTSMGDSIAWNWNTCFYPTEFWYSKEVRDRLRCVNPAASVELDEAAIKGEHTDDLLVDEGGELNNAFRVIEVQPELVTISIIGNDLLGVEPGDPPTQEEINLAIEEVLDSRSNLQETLSSLVSEIPGAEIELNTLYDNLADDCDSEPFHTEWIPILNRILRDLAWGQTRRVTNAEVFAEFAKEDLTETECLGLRDKICHFLGDDIHPNNPGYEVIREKLWESIGGVNLGPRDGNGEASRSDAHHGYLRRVARLFPTAHETLAGASVTDPEAAYDGDDGGAGASVALGIGSEEFRLSGFPGYFDEYEIARVIVGVRYRTTGVVNDDFYRIEASVDGAFRPDPGHDYTTTDWNYYTPIVGGGGPNKPDVAPDYSDAEVLVVPNVDAYREVSATLTKDPVVSPDGKGYDWPALTYAELATTEVRLAAAPVAATAGDAYEVVVDAAWLDIYGREKSRPGEVENLIVERGVGDGLDLSFDELAGASRYNVYFGSLAHLASEGRYDHGSDPPAESLCDVETTVAGPGRLATSVSGADAPPPPAYILVTGHVDDVESPTGYASDGEERDRSENLCP